MRAVQLHKFGGIDELYIGEVAAPKKQDEQILVKVHASALNRADLLQRQGKYSPPEGESDILGLEIAGEVVQPDIRGKWQKGDRVMALLAGGGQAELATVHKDLAMPIPTTIDFVQAAGVPEVFLTAYQAMFYEGSLKEGESVLIHAGASGVGTAAIQLAKVKGAKVIVSCSASKHQACYDLGANHSIDYKTEDFEEKVAEFTEGVGVNMVLDFIGGPNFMGNINSLAVRGHLVQIAMMGGSKTDQINLYPLLRKHLAITGTTLRSRSIAYKADLIANFYADFIEEISVGSIHPVIDSVFEIADIQKAHRRMAANENIGKIVLKL